MGTAVVLLLARHERFIYHDLAPNPQLSALRFTQYRSPAVFSSITTIQLRLLISFLDQCSGDLKGFCSTVSPLEWVVCQWMTNKCKNSYVTAAYLQILPFTAEGYRSTPKSENAVISRPGKTKTRIVSIQGDKVSTLWGARR